MALAFGDRERIAGALLNDIGPEVDPSGIDRIKTYVGKPVRFVNWDEAIDRISARAQDVYPDWGRKEWERFVRRSAREEGGAVVYDYDMHIADNFESAAAAPDLAPLPSAGGAAVTVLRGEFSDLLSTGTFERMGREIEMSNWSPARVGHSPTGRAESLAAIDRLLARVMEAQTKLGS